jgi:EAL domain-containing protein (putative c-di-GMP-specific phosphodiesterase class I)/ActR/RegA family two-component response regulator
METLLVDDDPFALKLLDRQLRTLGWTDITLCERAGDAFCALAERAADIDLVFCDLQMPDVDGVEFVRHLASIGYQGRLVLVSGEDGRILQTAQRLAEAHQIVVLAALAKPVSSERLCGVLAEVKPTRTVRLAEGDPPPSSGDLAKSIAADELLNHYQPKVALETGELVGVEALVRWRHPGRGLIFPDRFIATAEENGLIDALTLKVLEGALAQARRWADIGLDLRVAVNVSMDNLAALDFPDNVARALAAAGLAPTRLVLEVTESRLMKDPRAALDSLTRLRLKRIGLSIDDFGTGHSSLVQLRDVPFDELKIDRGFVSGVSGDASLRAIVEATLGMARQLGMKSVAEGVETRAEWDLLRDLGCDIAQGYWIARPMPANALLGWHREWERRCNDFAVHSS